MLDRIKPTRREVIAILLIAFAMVPMLWLGIYIQAAVLDPWFASEEEIESLQMELNRQDLRIDELEQSQKQLMRAVEDSTKEENVVQQIQPQPVIDAIQNHLWRERLRNWGR